MSKKAEPVSSSSKMTYGHVKGTFTRRFNACQEVVKNLQQSDLSSCSAGTIATLENLLSSVTDAQFRLESASDDMLSVWTEEEYVKEQQILEANAKKVQDVRFLIMDLTSPLNVSLNSCSVSSSQFDSKSDRPVRINEALKPEKLTADATLAEFRVWQTDFDLFYSSNQMDKFPPEEQQGYLRSCLDLKLSQLLATKIDAKTPVQGKNGCLEALRHVFLQLVPVLTRRYNFFRCDQKPGEKFSDWFLRLQLEGQEAELTTINEDYLYILRLVTGTCDKRLREEFLRQSNPTRESLYNIGISWESAALIETSLDSVKPKSIISAAKTRQQSNSSHPCSQSRDRHKFSSNRPQVTDISDLKDKCPGCGQLSSAHRRRDCPAFSKTCNSCGRRGHFQNVCTGGRFISNQNHLREGSRHRNQGVSKAKKIETSIIRTKTCKNESSNSTPLLPLLVYPKAGKAFSMKALPDTGATESLISFDLVQTFNIAMDKSQKLKIVAANESRLVCLGSVSLRMHLESDKEEQNGVDVIAFVTPDLKDELIISWHHLILLNVLPKSFPGSIVKSIKLPPSDYVCAEIERIFEQYSSVFQSSKESLKPMKGPPMHIYLREDDSIKPTHVSTARNIPFAFREKAELELNFMVSSGIIEPADSPSTWTSPCLVLPKPDGSIRFVVDYTGLNRLVKRPEHPFPSPHELSTSIPAQSKFFVVLDAVKGYWQIPLDQSSRELTTFLTPFGRYRYCRAPMGLNASGDEYCLRGDQALSGLKGVCKIVDDILIYASSMEELIERTSMVLKRCQEHGITLSRKKAQVGSTVKFAGFIINSQGVSPDPDKLAAISKFPPPTNLSELRSFLGLANQLGQFVPDLAHAAQPLRSLLKKNTAFQWLEEQQSAFEKVKQILTSPNSPVLAHFDTSLPTVLLTDASRLRGIGFALLQTYSDGSQRLIQCGSRFLTDAETRYSVCELEALGVQWSISKCRLYLAGIHFKVITDHKPLVGIFRGSNLDAFDNSRLQRIIQKTSGYTFDIVWIAGKDHVIADALSRAPIFQPEEEEDVNKVCLISIKSLTSSFDLALEKLSEKAKCDVNYCAIIQTLLQGKNPRDLDASHPSRPFIKVWQDLSFDNQTSLLLLNSHRIVVPLECRRDVLNSLHQSHQGLRRTRARARELYYWPGLNNDVMQVISQCQECSSLLPSQSMEPLQQSVASRPFQSVSADLFECSAKHYLLLVDRYSGWPLVSRLTKTSTSIITTVLQNWFCEYGIPESIRTDGGPQFRSEFTQFCKEFCINHELTSPYNSRSNGHAESTVKTMKHLLTKSKSWSTFQLNLLEWRNVPRSDGLSPAQWFFGRSIRTFAPAHASSYSRLSNDEVIRAEARREAQTRDAKQNHDVHAKELQPLQPDDLVWVQDNKSKQWNLPGRIINVRHNG
jgi:hypothetical protein